MPKSRKPRRAYRPQPVINPLNARNKWVIEGDVHACLLAIGAGLVEEEHLASLGAHADMVRRLDCAEPHEVVQAQALVRTLYDVMLRGKPITVRPTEEAAIRAAVQVTLGAVRRASNHNIFRAAVAARAELDRNGGLRV